MAESKIKVTLDTAALKRDLKRFLEGVAAQFSQTAEEVKRVAGGLDSDPEPQAEAENAPERVVFAVDPSSVAGNIWIVPPGNYLGRYHAYELYEGRKLTPEERQGKA